MDLRKNRFLRKIVYCWRNFQDKHSYTKGKGNQIINKGVKVASRLQIRGNNNYIYIEKDAVIRNTLIRIYGNNIVVNIKSGAYVSGAELWIEDNACKIIIGENTFVGHHSHLACTEDGSQLIIGKDGMLSSYVQIRTGDSHSILDLAGNRINQAQSVYIGNHCWIGQGAKILKGVTLEGDNVVSTGAIVTESFTKHQLIGGIPAKILKEDITWDKQRI